MQHTAQIAIGHPEHGNWEPVWTENVEGDDAVGVAEWVAANQTVTDGDLWRVTVWTGPDADTTNSPVCLYDSALNKVITLNRSETDNDEA